MILKEIFSDIPLKMRLAMFFAVLVLAIAICSCGSCSRMWQVYPQDNVVEEILEEAIDQETGLDLDLSPFSKENDVKMQSLKRGM